MRIFLFLTSAVLMSCEPPPPTDSRPPRLLTTEVSPDGSELALGFDEPVAEAKTELQAVPREPVIEGTKVKVPLPPGLKPGTSQVFSAEVTDGRNVTSVAGRFYPVNQHPAGLRLNEVRVVGSGIHTDLVELRVEASGSLGGWTLEAWSGPGARQRIVLPDQEVEAGEFIVVRYKPAQNPSDAAPGAHEFWQEGGKGLPGTKGMILLRQRPDGPGTDALLYSSRPGEAGPIAAAAGWTPRSELDPSNCTATRTWNRTEPPESTWIVVTSGGATPGAPNKLIPWEGKPSTRASTSKSKSRTRGLRRPARGSQWRLSSIANPAEKAAPSDRDS